MVVVDGLSLVVPEMLGLEIGKRVRFLHVWIAPQYCPLSFLQRRVQRPLLKTERRVEAEPTTESGGSTTS